PTSKPRPHQSVTSQELVADHLDRGLTYTEIAEKYDVALSTVSKYIQQAKRQRAKAPAQ
ncbi:hypothetical protein HMPREF1979_00162, partial [Actinomyces johnsonii F0542]